MMVDTSPRALFRFEAEEGADWACPPPGAVVLIVGEYEEPGFEGWWWVESAGRKYAVYWSELTPTELVEQEVH